MIFGTWMYRSWRKTPLSVGQAEVDHGQSQNQQHQPDKNHCPIHVLLPSPIFSPLGKSVRKVRHKIIAIVAKPLQAKSGVATAQIHTFTEGNVAEEEADFQGPRRVLRIYFKTALDIPKG